MSVRAGASSTNAAHVTGNEFCSVVVSAGSWVGVVPFTLVAGSVSVSFVGVVAGTTGATSTGAAHLLGLEAFGVVASAVAWVALVPVTAVVGNVASAVIGVPADLMEGKSSIATIAGAASLRCLEEVSVPIATLFWS